ncbi:hypothetical protein G7078_01785 [Sphingomonas sinipercae]|uniref:Uncharacterized protein n=1 Tax=Sphingomonas sinipercae TaxID=2714944 RepID=A0A6G7ZQR8_9SPHN|nr:hypothetical protein G7078_01785 [Sphingomonas sinipercae]
MRWLIAVLVLLSAIPLLYPKVPPLVDLLGHMGRYRVQLDLAQSESLQRFYAFDWAAIGNLGVDLLVVPLGAVFGLELAVKLIVLAIPPLTVGGFLWVSREVHHRVPPSAFFALPLAYGYPFLFGFVNFALSMALAFLAFALWLNLGERGRWRLRAALFVPISVIVFFTHVYGWGALGLLCFSGEAVRQHDRGIGWVRAGAKAAAHAMALTLPIVIMLAWRSEAHGGMTAGFFAWKYKWEWLYSALRDRWQIWDLASLAMIGLVLLFALVSRKLQFSRMLAFSAIVLAASFVLLPRIIFGSAYADMRLVPYMLAVFVLAIRFKGPMHVPTGMLLAVCGLAFFGLRLASTTASLAIAADDQAAKLHALDHVPAGARVASLVGRGCMKSWDLARNSHLGAMVIVRRNGFSNDQWVMEGMNLLGLRYRGAGAFSSDPSEMVHPNHCGSREAPRSINRALATIPRDGFDYVWLIDPLPFDPRLAHGLEPVWAGNNGSILLRSTGAAKDGDQGHAKR